MTAKVTFKPDGPEGQSHNGNAVVRAWSIKVGGEVIGTITSSIRDLYGSYSNPGYSVVVQADIVGHEKPYYRSSFAMDNRSIREARDNRSHYVREAKKWAAHIYEKMSEPPPPAPIH